MSDPLSSDLASLRIPRQTDAGPPRSRMWLVVLLVLLLLGAGAFVAVRSVGARVFQTEVEITQIRTISPAQASTLVTSTGYLVPQVESRVGPQALGRVAEVLVREGERVKAGDVLMRLDAAEQQSAVAASRARLVASRAREQSALASLAEARRQYEREKRLADEGATARSIAEDLASRVTVLEESARAAKADAVAAAAELKQLNLGLGYLTVTAPINGVVTSKPATIGELVGPMARGSLVDIADLSTLMVETDVPEARISLIKKDGPTEIVLDARPTVRYRGQVADISPRVNRVKATVVVKVKFIDPVEDLLPDMAARVGFLRDALDVEAMKEAPKRFVPGSAVVERDGRKVVFRVHEGKARMETVTLGAPQGEGFELLTGPVEGTRVIANPPPSLGDGYPIKEKV